MFTVGLTNLASLFSILLVVVVNYLGEYAVYPSYMPCVTDLFLLENLFSNSQVTKRIQ